MAPRPLTDVLQTRILEEVKLWAARRYDERANAVSPAAVDIVPDTSGEADYLVHLDLSHVPNAPASIQIQVVVEPDGRLCLATGD